MATWLEMSRSPEFSPAILSRELRKVHYLVGIDEFDEALAGETIILGGYLNTKLIKAKSIFAEHLDVDSLSAITANLGEVTSGTITSSTITGGTITGAIIRTDSGDSRVQLDGTNLKTYFEGVKRIELDYDSLKFFSSDGSLAGNITAGSPPYVERFYFKGNDRDVEISTGNMYRAYIDLMHNEPYPGLQNTGAVAIRANNNKGNSASIIVYGSGQISLATTPGDVFGGENRVFINAYQVLTRELVSCGRVNITPVPSQPTQVTVYFPIQFTKTPRVVATAYTDAAGVALKEVTVRAATTDSFNVVIYRTNAVDTIVEWIAVQPE